MISEEELTNQLIHEATRQVASGAVHSVESGLLRAANILQARIATAQSAARQRLREFSAVNSDGLAYTNSDGSLRGGRVPSACPVTEGLVYDIYDGTFEL